MNIKSDIHLATGTRNSESICRIMERNTGGMGITGKEKMHPALLRVLTGRQSTLLDLSPIFGK